CRARGQRIQETREPGPPGTEDRAGDSVVDVDVRLVDRPSLAPGVGAGGFDLARDGARVVGNVGLVGTLPGADRTDHRRFLRWRRPMRNLVRGLGARPICTDPRAIHLPAMVNRKPSVTSSLAGTTDGPPPPKGVSCCLRSPCAAARSGSRAGTS